MKAYAPTSPEYPAIRFNQLRKRGSSALFEDFSGERLLATILVRESSAHSNCRLLDPHRNGQHYRET